MFEYTQCLVTADHDLLTNIMTLISDA